jgi:hypothetical protein
MPVVGFLYQGQPEPLPRGMRFAKVVSEAGLIESGGVSN